VKEERRGRGWKNNSDALFAGEAARSPSLRLLVLDRLSSLCKPRQAQSVVHRHREGNEKEGDVGSEDLDEMLGGDAGHSDDGGEAGPGRGGGGSAIDSEERVDGGVVCERNGIKGGKGRQEKKRTNASTSHAYQR
jgi:hypothetical protein